MDNISIKNNIKRLRNEANLTIKEMAASLMISETAYKNLENGKTRIIFDRMDLLAAALKVSSEEILLGYAPVKPGSLELNDASFREGYIHDLCEQHKAEVRKLDEKLAENERIIKDLRNLVDMMEKLHTDGDQEG